MNDPLRLRPATFASTEHPASWFLLSLGVHLAAFVLLTFLVAAPVRKQSPVVIDLTLDTAGPPATSPQRSTAPVRRLAPPPERSAPVVPPTPQPQPPLPVRNVPVTPLPVAAATVVSSPVAANPAAVPVANGHAPAAVRPATGGSTPSRPAAAPAGETGEGAPSPAAVKQRYLKEHFTYIRDLVLRRLVYPPQARRLGWQGRVTVSFVVNADGSASSLRVLESSGYPLLDRSALETVRSAAPFPRPPLPAEIVIPVGFRLL